jgi:hypothetical protein
VLYKPRLATFNLFSHPSKCFEHYTSMFIIRRIIIIIIGSTALGGPWPLLEDSQQYFLWDGVVSLTPNPQPGGPGYPYLSGSSSLTCLAWETLPVACSICYCQHSSQDHLTTQAPPLHQSRDTFGRHALSHNLIILFPFNILNNAGYFMHQQV